MASCGPVFPPENTSKRVLRGIFSAGREERRRRRRRRKEMLFA
jgi:hypothetical protein